MKNDAKATVDINEIKHWVEQRHGEPAVVVREKKKSGVLRILFPGYKGKDKLEKISWEEWYKMFLQKHLSFIYQEKTNDDQISYFFKLISSV